MAVVFASDDSSYFSSGLRRSHSHIRFADTPSYDAVSTPTLKDPYSTPTKALPGSPASSAPSSPPTTQASSTSDFSSYPSTPATSSSVASDFDDDHQFGIVESTEDHYSFPLLVDGRYARKASHDLGESIEPPPSPRNGNSESLSLEEEEVENRPCTPEFGEHAEDDIAVFTRPSQQVDYLSHDWKEEDIWSSWRYIVSRRNEYANSARLENASWRTWMKAKNGLKTISPETLNWLKDCDVTWLYGPLQSGSSTLFYTHTEPSSQSLSKTNSFIGLKKPILKKRSMSEVMLQRSISTASLLKQATASVQAQETRGVMARPTTGRAHTSEYITFPFSSRRSSSQENPSSVSSSVDSSGLGTPCGERKHIHFNESVEQCIAVDVKGDEDEEISTDKFADESDSDEGVMMKRMRSKKRALLKSKRSRKSTPEGKTIAMLPSTTLKYRADTPEPRETALKHSTGVARSPSISPSSSQETLRPSRSPRFYLGEDFDDDDLGDDILPSTSGWRSPPRHDDLQRSASSSSLSDENTGMRRTASGMLMPLGEGDSSATDGIFGRVVDTVNTARDIAHVIWNVGWRR